MKKHLSKIIFALLVIIFIIICAITAPITESAGTLWSLLPPIVAIGLALITKEVYSSLFIGILTGGILTAANAGTGFEGMFNIIVQEGFYGYARVSTLAQELEVQTQTLQKNGATIIYQEKFTGTKTDRPELNQLLDVLKEGDTLMVTKLDRIARSATQGSEVVKELIVKGIKVHILNMGLLDNTPASKLIRNIFFAFAEFERDMIVERTQEGKAIARQNSDYREGRKPTYTRKQLEHALEKLASHSYNQVVEKTGISKSTLIRAMKKKRAE